MKHRTQCAILFLLLVASYSAEDNVRLTSIEQVGNDVKGEVEIHYEGTWRPLCARMWTKLDADVTCKTIGFHEGATDHKKNGLWGQVKRRDFFYLFLGLGCTGSEFNLDKCPNWDNDVMKLSGCSNGIAIAVCKR